jgi:thioesterase domain-containing protein
MQYCDADAAGDSRRWQVAQDSSVRAYSAPLPEAEVADDLPRAATVARIFADLFELESVALDDDFFELGGDSLVGAALTAEIERYFGVGLSISALLEAPTPSALAEAIAGANRERLDRVLVPVRATGEGPGIFCVHGSNGASFFPRRLAEHVDRRPLYGLRAYGFGAGESPPMTIEAMADVYLAAITDAQPKGPYVVLGHCAGTTVAWEIARRLIAAGETVSGLILIDPEVGEAWAPFLYRSGLALGLLQSLALKRAHEALAQWEDRSAEGFGARAEFVRDSIYLALGCYAPEPLACPTLLVCSSERRAALLNPTYGYQKLLADLEWVELEGKHPDLFQGRMDELVVVMRRFLERVAPIEAVPVAVAR